MRAATLFLAAVLLHAPDAAFARPPARPATPASPQVLDWARRVDVNQLNMWATNFGHLAWDVGTGNAGLIYPRGSGKTVVFASGLWLGCTVNGEVRTVVAEYSSEYGPGAMAGGLPDDPKRPEYQVYKVARWSGDPADSAYVVRTPEELAADPGLDPLAHHSWSMYMHGAAPFGAPWRMYRLPVTSTPDPSDSVDVPGPDVSGDQMLWCVYNDADPIRHENDAGGSAPLGVEIQQTIFAYGGSSALSTTVFLVFRIANQGSQSLQSMYASLWADPDVGGVTDDLVGCDPAAALGYAYNATNSDAVYGNEPPAVGFDLLAGPGPGPPPMSAFSMYTNGTDPATTEETYNHMQGLRANGDPLIDPTTGQPTKFYAPGDPVAGTGWLDSAPADRRMMPTCGPFSMAPGDVRTLVVALIVGQGSTNLSSVAALRCADRLAQEFHDAGFTGTPPPPDPTCAAATSCPRPSEFWAQQCPSGAVIPQATMEAIAGRADQQSMFFDWAGNPLAGLCATLGPAAPPDERACAKQEFAVLLANYCATGLGVVPAGQMPIRLSPQIGISCSGVAARTVAELVQTADVRPQLLSVDYLNLNPANRRALTGVNWSGNQSWFFGGAGPSWDFLGSTLDPAAVPDSFSTVEVRFDPAQPQKAYRYLRLEKASDGGPPPQGRAYLYGGHHWVPLTASDTARGVQLDVAFVERTLTDDAGTILPLAQQPATRDSTWGPGAEFDGGREFLFVMRPAYSEAPKPFYAVDGAIASGELPALYTLWAMLRTSVDVIDPGDALRFTWGVPVGPGVDDILIRLEPLSLEDPAVRQEYAAVAQCLADINRGIGIGPICDEPTPALLSLFEARAEPGRAYLAWYAPEGAPMEATLYRSRPGGAWATVAQLRPDGSGSLRYVDALPAGGRYGYRLGVTGMTGEEFFGETWLDVPSVLRLALRALANPSTTGLDLVVSLPSRAPALLELYDVRGRRVGSRSLPALEAGEHTVRLEGAVRLPAGVYEARLVQEGRVASGRVVLLR